VLRVPAPDGGVLLPAQPLTDVLTYRQKIEVPIPPVVVKTA
jgi:hypothetical protein